MERKRNDECYREIEARARNKDSVRGKVEREIERRMKIVSYGPRDGN